MTNTTNEESPLTKEAQEDVVLLRSRAAKILKAIAESFDVMHPGLTLTFNVDATVTRNDDKSVVAFATEAGLIVERNETEEGFKGLAIGPETTAGIAVPPERAKLPDMWRE